MRALIANGTAVPASRQAQRGLDVFGGFGLALRHRTPPVDRRINR